MGSFTRLRYVIAANVNSLLEKAEDPEKLLRALIRDMEDAAEDARLASADLLAEQSHLLRMQERYQREITQWTERAEKSVASNRDDLARTALKSKTELEQALQSASSESETLAERLTQLETDVATLRHKLTEAKSRLKDIQQRHRPRSNGQTANNGQSVSPAERKVRRAMGRFDRLQSQVERLEARVSSYDFGGQTSTVWVAEETPTDPAIEAELEQLKACIVQPEHQPSE